MGARRRTATHPPAALFVAVAFSTTAVSAQLPHAVCLSGGWRAFGTTAPSLREHVLEPWRAEPFAVIEGDASDTRRCKALLTVRGRSREPHCLVGTGAEIAKSSVAVARAAAAFESPLIQRRQRDTIFASMLARGNRARVLMVLACHDEVMAHEAARGAEYTAYAHIRPDLYFYLPLPARFMAPYAADEVRIPAGDEWSSFDQLYVGYNCDLQFAGRHAFKAISQVWRVLADPAEVRLFVPNWTSEQLWRRAFEVASARVEKPPLGYCKISKTGACRYFGQLAQLLRLEPTILATHPEAHTLFCRAAARPCANTTDVTDVLATDVCTHFCSASGHCGRSRAYRRGGTDCTGCTEEVAASGPSARCPDACRECRAGGSHDGGVGLGPAGTQPWPIDCVKPFCGRFCSASGHCGRSRAYRRGGTDCTGCTEEVAASEPSARCPDACRECRAGGSHDGGVGLEGPKAPHPYAWPCAEMVPQTAADAEYDRGWCKLARALDDAHACPRWGGQARLAQFARSDDA